MPRRFMLAGFVLSVSIGAALACGSFATTSESTPDGSADGSPANDGGTLEDGKANDGAVVEDAGPPLGCAQKGQLIDERFAIPPPTQFGIKSFDSARKVAPNHVYVSGLPTDGGDDSKMFSFVLATNKLDTNLKAFDGVNWVEEDHHPFVFDDEKAVIFESKKNNPPSGGRDRLNVMRRVQPGVAFNAAVVDRIGISVNATDIEEPWIVEQASGSRIFFSLTQSGVPDRIWSGELDLTNKAITNPVAHAELATQISGSTASTELGHPVLTADGRKIYFSAKLASGDRRVIYSATRSGITAVWGVPSVVTELFDETADQHPTWIAPDDCEMLYIRGATLQHARRAAN